MAEKDLLSDVEAAQAKGHAVRRTVWRRIVSVAAETAHRRSDSAVLRRGAAGALLVQVSGAALGLLAHLLIAKMLGATAYGAYALTLTWIGLLAVPALLGQDIAVVRNLPEYTQRQAWALAKGLVRGTALMVGGASILLAAGGAAVIYLFTGSANAMLRDSLFAGFLLLPILTQLHLNGGVHRGLKRAVSSGVFNNVARPILILGALGIAPWFLNNQLTAPIAVLLNCAAAFLSLVLSVWFLAKAWPASARNVNLRYDLRAWTILGGQLSLLSVIAMTLNRVDVLVLGALGTTRDVGSYYASVQVSNIALYGLNAVNTLLAPMIAERFSARDLPGLQAITKNAARWAFATALLVSLVFIVVGKNVLELFGDGFVRAYSSLLILLAGYSISTAFGEVGFLLSMTHYQKQAAYIMGMGVAVNLVLSVVLIPQFDMVGAALAAAISIVTWRAVALTFVMRRLQFNPSVWGH